MDDFVAIKERIRDSVDLVDFVSEHTALVRRGRNFVGLCPFHQEKTPSFTVNAERQFFKCFGCNAGGDIFTFVQLRESVDFAEALRILADRAGIELTAAPRGGVAGSTRADIARANAWAAEYFRKNLTETSVGREAAEYLIARGINTESLDRFGIGVATGADNPLLRAAQTAGFDPGLLQDAGLCRRSERGSVYDTFRERIIFPIRDTTGRCLGFGGRTLIDDRAKYLNTSETTIFNKSRCLYGLDLARPEIEKSGTSIVVEGYTDCIAAHQHGFTNTVAALGTAATDGHMSMLRRYGENIVLVFDSDSAGAAAADRALGVALKQNLNVTLATVPEEKDPCDYLQNVGADGFRNLLNSASPALVFRWNNAKIGFEGAATSAARRKAVEEFVSLVADLAGYGVLDAIQQGIVIGQLSQLLSVSEEQVVRMLSDQAGRGRNHRPREVQRGQQERSSPPCDAEQAALHTMLEVLVNEPGLYGQVADQFSGERFSLPAYRRIAEHVEHLAQTLGEFRLAELLSQVSEPADAELLTDLAIRGANRGNYAATLEGAARRLREVAAERDTDRITEEVKRGESEGSPLSDDELRGRLSQIGTSLAGRSGFAHRRAIKDTGEPPIVSDGFAESVGR